MKSAATKVTEVLKLFKDNFVREYESNPILQGEFHGLCRGVSSIRDAARPILSGPIDACSGFYRGMQFADFLLGRLFRSVFSCNSQRASRRGSALDSFMEKTLQIPQFYGGIRDRSLDNQEGQATRAASETRTDRLGCKFKIPFGQGIQSLPQAWASSRVYHDFQVLSRIENETVPQIMLDLFGYRVLRNTAHEAAESLKKMRSELLSSGLKNTKISLVDVRQTGIEKVYVKNLKKLVKCRFEFTVEVGGYVDRKYDSHERHFSGIIEFVKDEAGDWVAGSFSHEAV